MRLQATWIIPGILITLLLGLLWAMPASAADAGDIMFLDGDDEISYVSLNGPAAVGGFTVQIEDQDLDTPTRYVDDPDDSSARSRLEGTAANTDPIDWENLANMSGDNLININDIKVFDAETGGNDITITAGVTVDIANGNLAGAGAGEWLEFHINKQDTIGSNALDLITVESSGGGDNMVSLEETGASTGKFTLTVVICDSDSAATINTCTITNNEAVAVQTGTTLSMPVDKAGDTITVQYRDASPRTTRTMRISLDTNNPTFSNIAPAHNTAGTEKEPDLSFDVVDSESGISDGADDNIRIIAALYSADGADTLINGPLSINLEEDLRADEIDDGYSAEARLREGTRTGELDAGSNDEYEIRWWAVAIDIAGNTGVSDSNSKTECIYSGEALTSTDSQLITDLMGPDDTTTTDIESCDPNVVRVDSAAPELVSATTGTFLKADGKTEGFGSRTSIVAVFNEDLDCASVDADDFDVGGDAPNSITCKGEKVYLSVDEMDPNATPTVSVVAGSLSDRAGNAIEQEDDADQEEEADDGIPAGLTVTIEGTGAGDRPVTNGAITVTVSSDERLRSRPTVEIKMVGDDYVLGSDVGGPARPTGNTNEWSFNGDPGSSGLYNVYVTADDRQSTTQSTAGSEGDANGSIEVAMDEDKALLFEVDEAVTTPTFLPEDEGETDNAGVFIRANFGSEGNEYGLGFDDNDTPVDETDDTRPATDMSVGVVTKFDTHSKLTLVEATFNDEDVTDDVISRDGVLFVYRPGNLENGEHTFEIEVEDNAGNGEDVKFSTTFNKIDKPPYEVSLNPGPNLISFPANPDNGDINAVFGGEGNEDITSVLTYENTTGLWMTANKAADGTFTGDLTTINGMNGYWVVADGVVDVNVLLEGSGNFIQPPPHIVVSEGWNLVGVVDASQREAGTPISGYFDNIEAEVVYGYDSLNAALVRQTDESDVTTGSGYWVYANEAGIIIP